MNRLVALLLVVLWMPWIVACSGSNASPTAATTDTFTGTLAQGTENLTQSVAYTITVAHP